MPSPTPSIRSIITLSALSFGVLGAALTLPGTLLPLLVEQFHIRLVEAGSMLALQQVGYLVSVLVAGRLIRRLGMRAILSLGLFTSAIGFLGFGSVSSWIGGSAMMLVSGLGFGIMEVGINTLLIQVGGTRRNNLLNLAHLLFGVGSFMGPALATRAVSAGWSWRAAFRVAAALIAAVASAWSATQLANTTEDDSATSLAPDAKPEMYLAVLLAATLGVYVGVEMGIGGWLTKYMVSARGVDLTMAGSTLSLYWLGLAAGRLLLSAFSHHVKEESLLLALAVIATAALLSALAVETGFLVTLAFTATGVGFSGIFPAIIALGGRCHPQHTATVTSVMIAGAGIGSIVIPWTMSAISDAKGLIAGMTFYAVMAFVLILLITAVRRSFSRAEANPDPRKIETGRVEDEATPR